jgi:two-component system NtrC family response regulator
LSRKARVLIVNDDESFIRELLEQDRSLENIRFDWADNPEKAKEKLQAQPYQVVVVKNPLSDRSVFPLMPGLMGVDPSTGFIICSSEGSSDEAEQMILEGVFEYLPYPISVPDLLSAVEQVLENLKNRLSDLDEKDSNQIWSDAFIGESLELANCLEMASRAAATDVNILITGETGTGKELLAELIHKRSSSGAKNFIVVDCAALPEHLVESTLYGHEKGAFTSAERSRKGLIQEANGGTLFLDEIGELSLEIQKRFLRVLDTKTYRRVGGDQELYSDFRLIAATHRDLDEMISKGKFREDLLYRLDTFHIHLPALRDRPEDIPLLAHHHLEQYCRDLGQPVKRLSNRFLSTLKDYSWPGNIRELFSAVERSVTAAVQEDTLHRFHLPVAIRIDSARKIAERTDTRKKRKNTGKRLESQQDFPTLTEVREVTIADAESDYLLKLVTMADGDVDLAVRISGLSRSRLYALLKKYGLSLKN